MTRRGLLSRLFVAPLAMAGLVQLEPRHAVSVSTLNFKINCDTSEAMSRIEKMTASLRGIGVSEGSLANDDLQKPLTVYVRAERI